MIYHSFIIGTIFIFVTIYFGTYYIISNVTWRHMISSTYWERIWNDMEFQPNNTREALYEIQKMMIWFNLRCVIPTSKIVLNSEGMTSIVYCLYSNYHFCISHEVYVFLQSLFHIKFVCRSFYFVIDLLEYIWYTGIMEWEIFSKLGQEREEGNDLFVTVSKRSSSS